MTALWMEKRELRLLDGYHPDDRSAGEERIIRRSSRQNARRVDHVPLDAVVVPDALPARRERQLVSL